MKLRLRDLFWLILVAAVGTMWWIDRSRLAIELNGSQSQSPRIQMRIPKLRSSTPRPLQEFSEDQIREAFEKAEARGELEPVSELSQ